jgi:hypothetical protein
VSISNLLLLHGFGNIRVYLHETIAVIPRDALLHL